MPAIDHLECAHCHHSVPAESAHAVCPLCAGPLLIRYDMEAVRQTARREEVALRAAAGAASLGIWRYARMLPDVEPVTLGEGGTSLLRSRQYPNLFLKQEAASLGGGQARGFALAVAVAKHRGIRHVAAAGGSEDVVGLAAYAAAAGLSAHLYLPRDAPFTTYVEAAAYGAEVTLIDGSLPDCVRALDEFMKIQAESAKDRWLDLSAASEPFRLEGMKTLGYELAEQMGWTCPDAILYPAADEAGLIGIRKAFEEMEQLGWVAGRCPALYSVRATSDGGKSIDESFGAILIDTEAGIEKTLDWARGEGILLSREGAAAAVAYDGLLASGELKATDTVVLIDPRAGLKYSAEIAKALHLGPSVTLPTSAKVGGIITPI